MIFAIKKKDFSVIIVSTQLAHSFYQPSPIADIHYEGFMKHLFITGKIQTGKSTTINRALENKNLILGGYRTVSSLRDRDYDSYVHLLRVDRYEPLAPHNRALYRQVIYGRTYFHINNDIYETKGASLLRNLPEGCQLILMDEIGKREKFCANFRQALWDVLDGDIPVLGVVQIRPDGFLDKIRNHPNVELLELTTENREEVLAYINHYLETIISA